jgi:O-antigen/teichoic acid export membrane protein
MPALTHFNALFRRIKKSEFARHVRILATGTLLAQVISLAASPFLTRLYGAESYAVLALFSAIVGTIAPAAAFCYDTAVVIAKEEKDGDGLLVLSIWAAGAISLLMLLVFTLGQQPLKAFLSAGSLGLWWLLLPFSLFLTAAVTAFKYYANRHKRYDLISQVLVAQALFGSALSISLGVAGLEADGLLISAILSTVFGTILLAYSCRKKLQHLHWRPSRITWDLAKRYRQFPIYGASTTFLDGITAALPVLMLTKFFSLAVVGQFALGLRVFSTPLAFVATSVSQVHLRKAAELAHSGPVTLPRYTLKLSFLLLLISGVPSIALYFFIPTLFAFVFGEVWRAAGEILVVLLPALVIKFVASSVSGVFSATGHLNLLAMWKAFGLLVTFLGLSRAVRHDDVLLFFYALMAIDLFLYVLLFAAIMYAVKHIRY